MHYLPESVIESSPYEGSLFSYGWGFRRNGLQCTIPVSCRANKASDPKEYLVMATMAKVIHSIPNAVRSENELIGFNQGLRHVWKAIQMVARTDSAVLIHGETGTGKELI